MYEESRYGMELKDDVSLAAAGCMMIMLSMNRTFMNLSLVIQGLFLHIIYNRFIHKSSHHANVVSNNASLHHHQNCRRHLDISVDTWHSMDRR